MENFQRFRCLRQYTAREQSQCGEREDGKGTIVCPFQLRERTFSTLREQSVSAFVPCWRIGIGPFTSGAFARRTIQPSVADSSRRQRPQTAIPRLYKNDPDRPFWVRLGRPVMTASCDRNELADSEKRLVEERRRTLADRRLTNAQQEQNTSALVAAIADRQRRTPTSHVRSMSPTPGAISDALSARGQAFPWCTIHLCQTSSSPTLSGSFGSEIITDISLSRIL